MKNLNSGLKKDSDLIKDVNIHSAWLDWDFYFNKEMMKSGLYNIPKGANITHDYIKRDRRSPVH